MLGEAALLKVVRLEQLLARVRVQFNALIGARADLEVMARILHSRPLLTLASARLRRCRRPELLLLLLAHQSLCRHRERRSDRLAAVRARAGHALHRLQVVVAAGELAEVVSRLRNHIVRGGALSALDADDAAVERVVPAALAGVQQCVVRLASGTV